MQKLTAFLREFKYILMSLVILLLFFMLWKGCGDKGQKTSTDLDAVRDSLKAAQTEIANLQVQYNKVDASNQQLAKDTAANGVKLRQAETALINIQKRYISKRADIKIPSYIPDTTKYMELLAISDSMLQAGEDYRVWSIGAITKRDSMLIGKDSAIVNLMQQLAACQNALGYVDTKIPEIKKEAKPRNQLYVGVMAFGNQKAYIKGWGPSAALVTKSGQIFEGGIILLDKQQFYSVGAKFRLSLKN